MRDVPPALLHFAALESPVHAFRALCGAWREAANWTTDATRVTCPECEARLAGRRALTQGAPAPGAALRAGTRAR